MLQKSKIK